MHGADRRMEPPAEVNGVGIDAGLEKGDVGARVDEGTALKRGDGFLELAVAMMVGQMRGERDGIEGFGEGLRSKQGFWD